MALGSRVMLMKPGPAMLDSSMGSATPATSMASITLPASSRGCMPKRLASGMAQLDWKSPNLGWREGVMCVWIWSRGRSGRTVLIASLNRSSRTEAGSMAAAESGLCVLIGQV